MISARAATPNDRRQDEEGIRLQQGKAGLVVPQPGKTRITIYLDDHVIAAFRDRTDAEGRCYQTMINEALREYLGQAREPVDAETIRPIVREELRKTG